MGCIWSGLFIRSDENIPWLVNPFLLQENQKFFIFSKMILRVMPKFLPILLLLGASVVQFLTQKFFRSSQCINYAFKTSPRNHSFATKWFRVSQVIVIFLCGCTKSKSVIFTSLRQSITISKLAHMWDFAPFFPLAKEIDWFGDSEKNFDFRFSIFDFRFSFFDFVKEFISRLLIFAFRFSIFVFRFSIFVFRFSIFVFRFCFFDFVLPEGPIQ